jgi:hypothetical protein
MYKKQENFMRRVAIALLATAGIALATPALAQGIYFGPGGVGIGFGNGGYGGGYYGGGYGGGYAPGYQYGGYAPGYQYGPGYGSGDSYAYSPGYRRCRTVTIETPNGNLRRVRRCS